MTEKKPYRSRKRARRLVSTSSKISSQGILISLWRILCVTLIFSRRNISVLKMKISYLLSIVSKDHSISTFFRRIALIWPTGRFISTRGASVIQQRIRRQLLFICWSCTFPLTCMNEESPIRRKDIFLHANWPSRDLSYFDPGLLQRSKTFSYIVRMFFLMSREISLYCKLHV